jgi:hypothetical protein
MFRIRNLLGVSIAVVVMLAIMTTGVFAHPAQQTTATPEATAVDTVTPEATLGDTATPEATIATPTATITPTIVPSPTSVAPAVSPLATPKATIVGTPSTLPTTGGSDDGAAVVGLLALTLGAMLLLGAAGVARSQRTR